MIGIPHSEIDKYWEYVVPEIRRALEHNQGDHDELAIYCGIQQRDMQLWIGSQYTLVTELIRYPTGKLVCDLLLLAGENADNWLDDIELIDQWCQEVGADEIRVSGRVGWKRKLKPYGFEHAYTVLAREVRK